MFFNRERANRAVQTVLEEHGDLSQEALAAMCVETVLAMPIAIPERVVDLAIETYNPGITQMRRDRMRQALEAVFNARR